MMVHAKMPNYNVAINQRSKSDIYHQNNQPAFFNRENSFNFVLGLLSLKKFINVRFQGMKSILSQNRNDKSNQSMIAKGETGTRQDEYRKYQIKLSR